MISPRLTLLINLFCKELPNGLRYWLAGEMTFTNENQRFAQFYFRMRTLPANPVHALLGSSWNKTY